MSRWARATGMGEKISIPPWKGGGLPDITTNAGRGHDGRFPVPLPGHGLIFCIDSGGFHHRLPSHTPAGAKKKHDSNPQRQGTAYFAKASKAKTYFVPLSGTSKAMDNPSSVCPRLSVALFFIAHHLIHPGIVIFYRNFIEQKNCEGHADAMRPRLEVGKEAVIVAAALAEASAIAGECHAGAENEVEVLGRDFRQAGRWLAQPPGPGDHFRLCIGHPMKRHLHLRHAWISKGARGKQCRQSVQIGLAWKCGE